MEWNVFINFILCTIVVYSDKLIPTISAFTESSQIFESVALNKDLIQGDARTYYRPQKNMKFFINASIFSKFDIQM